MNFFNKTLCKKKILIDIKGVLTKYKGEDLPYLLAALKPGAKEFLEELSKDYKIKAFTTDDKLVVVKWLMKNKIHNYVTSITNVIEKDTYIFISDNCINFNGDFSDLKIKINNFK